MVLVLSATSTIFQLYCGGQCYCWRKPEYPEKTTDLPQLSHWQTLSHNVLSSTPRPSGILNILEHVQHISKSVVENR